MLTKLAGVVDLTLHIEFVCSRRSLRVGQVAIYIILGISICTGKVVAVVQLISCKSRTECLLIIRVIVE
ncbi:Uncharacterised protein [Segatella copri]|nr:Uncharacterised protein [Segatella copri]